MWEYYVYKMYNLLTPFSYRVRLLRVEYIDTSGKKKPRDNYAFIIEPTDQMALRLNAKEFDRKGISNHSVDRNTATIMGLFQLLVGNTDWSIPNMHNIKLLRVADAKYPMPVAVPYDFDYCGIIDAQYAIPNEIHPIEKVTERFYMGACNMKKLSRSFMKKEANLRLCLLIHLTSKKEVKVNRSAISMDSTG